MTDEPIKAAELRGYGKGYAAGRRRAVNQIATEQRARRDDIFWQRAFFATLPSCVNAEGWTRDTKPISTLVARVELAADFADSALLVVRRKNRI